MPDNIIGEYPCRICGGRSVEGQTEREYYWVDFRVVLKEAITNYSCRNCTSILIQFTNHKEEKCDQKR